MRQPRIVLLQRVMLAQAHHVLSTANMRHYDIQIDVATMNIDVAGHVRLYASSMMRRIASNKIERYDIGDEPGSSTFVQASRSPALLAFIWRGWVGARLQEPDRGPARQATDGPVPATERFAPNADRSGWSATIRSCRAAAGVPDAWHLR